MMMMAMGSLQLLQFHPLASSSSSSLPPSSSPPPSAVDHRFSPAPPLPQPSHQEEEDDDCAGTRVLELLRKNRDMIFSEVKLTIMIEDQREVERRRLLGIEDPDAPTREDLVEALEEVNEGKVPENRIALRMLAEEMTQWPNLEVEAPKKKVSKSLYAKATDTGVDPREAAKRLNMDWDSAAEIEDPDVSDETEVPPAVDSSLAGIWSTVLSHCFSGDHRYICSIDPLLQFSAIEVLYCHLVLKRNLYALQVQWIEEFQWPSLQLFLYISLRHETDCFNEGVMCGSGNNFAIEKLFLQSLYAVTLCISHYHVLYRS
ncbi:Ycf3-interacting protein 1, chloroplastic [Vitis vinifera]|uniref:Ycf3-interacting protein 1, chloroplastic n=1 Tax=Vitis vinifera TaxID=29760 RepID=A0A438HGP5_VITVI|nr:Ycf3-interacting protein 1, chloroplastic [Vitis vinifera]